MASWIRKTLRIRDHSRNTHEEEVETPYDGTTPYVEEENEESIATEQETRQIIGHLEVTIFQNVDIELYGNLHRRTFDFIVHEGPEEILKLFMHIHGRSLWGRRGKHVATALVPITHAIENGSDSRMVQLIVQPGNQPAATIFVDLKFSRLGDSEEESDSDCEWNEDVPLVLMPPGNGDVPQLAIPDTSFCRDVESNLADMLEEERC